MLPTTLNLGSGKDWRNDCFNADIQANVKPDWVCDISKVIWGEIVNTRFGQVKIKPEIFDKVIANDVLEHIQDLVPAMRNCRDLLKPNGEFHISVPYDLSLGAWQDPTHVRAFNENSWVYYADWHWYLGWEKGFSIQELGFNLSDYGQELLDDGKTIEQIAKTPRAIDSMKVILCKQ